MTLLSEHDKIILNKKNVVKAVNKAKANEELLEEELHKKYSDILALGGAGCRLCAECTYPDTPCRFPEKRMSEMEAYGLIVSDVCMKNGLKLYYGPDTVTFSGVFLIKENRVRE